LCNKQQQERSPPLSPRPKPLSTVRELSKTQPFLGHFYIKMIILPRLARDKHRENSKKAPFLAPVYILKLIVLPRQARDKHREKSTQKERERETCAFSFLSVGLTEDTTGGLDQLKASVVTAVATLTTAQSATAALRTEIATFLALRPDLDPLQVRACVCVSSSVTTI
jgi:hypothetical protein